MNYRLSCGTDRVKGKNCFVCESEGRELKSLVFKTISSNMKENILETIFRGIKGVRDMVSHNDILCIEVQNQHLCQWLSGEVEYKGYEDYLDKVFSVLESVDCRYKFVFVKKPYALVYGANHDLSRGKLLNLESAFEGMD